MRHHGEFPRRKGTKLNVLLRPEDLRVDEIHGNTEAEGLIGYIRERNYKGMTLESVVELENGKMVMVSEFFNEDDLTSTTLSTRKWLSTG